MNTRHLLLRKIRQTYKYPTVHLIRIKTLFYLKVLSELSNYFVPEVRGMFGLVSVRVGRPWYRLRHGTEGVCGSYTV